MIDNIVAAVIRHDEIYCSEEVLKDVFSEDKMVLLYRFYFEVEKAKSSIDLNARPLHSNRNINLLPDYGGMDINIGKEYLVFKKKNSNTTSNYKNLALLLVDRH